MKLHTDTPLATAIFQLFSEFDKKLVIALKETQVAGTVKAYVFGGCAVHLFTNARGSDDLDVEVKAAVQLDINSLILDVDDIYYNDPNEGDKLLSMDANFNVALPSLHPDYKERVIPLSIGDTVLHVFLVSAIDIAVSKLARCQADDVKDIVALFNKEYFSVEEFKEIAYEAAKYSINPDQLRLNIEHVILKLGEN